MITSIKIISKALELGSVTFKNAATKTAITDITNCFFVKILFSPF